MCSIQLVVSQDATEHLIKASGSSLTLLGETQEEVGLVTMSIRLVMSLHSDVTYCTVYLVAAFQQVTLPDMYPKSGANKKLHK